MFELNDLRQTRFFQDVFEEGKKQGRQEVFEEAKQEGKQEVFEEAKQEGKQEVKLEIIPHLLALGLSVEQIAQALGFDEEVVRQAAQPKS